MACMPPQPAPLPAPMSSSARSWLIGQVRWERLLDDLRTAQVGRAVDAALPTALPSAAVLTAA